MILLHNKNIRVLIFVANIVSVDSNELFLSYNASPRTVSKCPLPVTVLDFIRNSSQPDLEIKWPCEVRSYWLSLQPFVRSVRFLLRYVTPFVIIIEQQILMRREFCQHGTFPVHVDLAGCRSHLDARHRRGVPIRSSRLPELFRGYNHHQPGYETDSVFEFVPCQKIKPWGSAMYLYIALSTWLPLLFISIGNLLLIIRMRKSYKIHNELTHNFRYRSSRTHNSSRTLLAVAIVHLILLLPLGIVETLELYWDVILIKYPAKNAGENERYIHWLQEKMLLKWCRGLFFHIYHWNFAINFFLYYLTGKKFRSVVTQTLKSYTDTYLPCHKNVLRCNTWSNCHKHLRSSSVLLMRAVMRSKQFNDMARGSASERSSNVT
ncbi:uncharacterized protein LOC105431310 isoform X4 [Pogonomyrmex barbatus]|uniref:Uncharacterized protein LOC105431310 isoform X4 n=1 Tax=Pogonomyrmex barbatus TaxID=144034 RepID=A0A8N1S8V0_9HYME|nr:uncharacterized protein LOC105431310 isoform X4 [Pogonomyrmex barbatus]